MCRSNREAQVLTAVEQMKAKPPPSVTCVENEDDSDEENAPQVRHLTFNLQILQSETKSQVSAISLSFVIVKTVGVFAHYLHILEK